MTERLWLNCLVVSCDCWVLLDIWVYNCCVAGWLVRFGNGLVVSSSSAQFQLRWQWDDGSSDTGGEVTSWSYVQLYLRSTRLELYACWVYMRHTGHDVHAMRTVSTHDCHLSYTVVHLRFRYSCTESGLFVSSIHHFQLFDNDIKCVSECYQNKRVSVRTWWFLSLEC